MSSLKQYLLSVIICAIVCSVISCFFKKKSANGMTIQLLSGIFMTITIISPLMKVQLPDLNIYYDSIYHDALQITNDAKYQTRNHTSQIIKENTEAYILVKADSMNADITVDVVLDQSDPPIPVEVYINGTVSPYEKSVLSEYIQTNLNITKENQIWR